MMETAVPSQQSSAESAISGASAEESAIIQMNSVLERQQKAFLHEGFVSLETRQDRLDRVLKLIGENQNDIIEAVQADFGSRSRHQSQMLDVMSIMDSIKHTQKNVGKWMKADKRKVMFPLNLMGAKAQVEYQPKGVIGNIAAWNVPVHIGITPLAGIFAAGNRGMVKLSEITPETSLLVQQLISKYFDETECFGVTGDAAVGAAFASMPFDHIIFTGATGIGRHILRAAADNLTPVTLELGGKSPVIVGRSYDTKKAAERVFTGKALNVGQLCLAPDYCYVPREEKEQFITAATNHFSTMFPTMLNNPDYSAVVNARHYQRLINVIEDAKAKGGDVRPINPANEDFTQQKEGVHKIPLTMIVDPTDDMLAMQEELFGPVICVKTYDHVNECIQFINSRPRPLGLYYFGEDPHEEREVLDRTISGGVAINDVLAHVSCEDLPFGGVGHSGMGNYHGREGFLTFSHQKAVFRQTKIDLMKLAGMMPPYGKKCENQLDKLTKVK